jgi:hypothetical protein
VAYKLFDDKKAKPKKMPTQADAMVFHNALVAVAQELGGDTKVISELPDPGELYLVRLANLPGSEVFLGYNAPWPFLDKDDIRPCAKWRIQWAAGVYAISKTYFKLYDFDHPQVQAVFSYCYDMEDVFYKPEMAIEQFYMFQERLLEAKARVDNEKDKRLLVKILHWEDEYRMREHLRDI